MKKTLSMLGLLMATSVPFGTMAANYVIDTEGGHASINFKASHLGYSYILGRFDKFSGTFSYDPKDIPDSKVQVKVDTMSLNSNHAERDKHLRSSEFINADKYSTAEFKSTKVVDKGQGNFTIKGNLTLHGQTKPISIDAHFIGAGKDPWGGERAGFEGTTRLNLADFGIKAMGIIDHVDMQLYVEGIKQ
jgi:polyisoprenoid-binding protein YceI